MLPSYCQFVQNPINLYQQKCNPHNIKTKSQDWLNKMQKNQPQHRLTQPMDPEIKSLNLNFPTKHVIPESLAV